MKIIIDIDDNLYTRFSDVEDINAMDMFKGCVAIRKGIPLPKGHGDLIDRTEVIKSLFDYHNGKKTIGQCIDDVPAIIEAEKTTINHEKTTITDGDLISRQAVSEYVSKMINNRTYPEERQILEDFIEWLDNLPSAEKTTSHNFTQPQTTNTDLISRQSVITMLQKIENAVEDGDGFQFNEWIYYAKHIPSAEKTAEWIDLGFKEELYGEFGKCSNCGYESLLEFEYCPWCGRRTKGGEE